MSWDKFEATVRRPGKPFLFHDGLSWVEVEAIVIRLLRRERAALVRAVRRLEGWNAHEWAGGQVAMLKAGHGQWLKRKDVLALLAARKGKQ